QIPFLNYVRLGVITDLAINYPKSMKESIQDCIRGKWNSDVQHMGPCEFFTQHGSANEVFTILSPTTIMGQFSKLTDIAEYSISAKHKDPTVWAVRCDDFG
ncbi:unnamed protein product, partial [Meganyctiphanes norvegica]